MSALVILVAIFGLLNLAFAGFLYLHSNKNAVITFYVLISVFASLWSISTLLIAAGIPFVYLRYALSGHYVFGYLAYLSFFWFALYFPKRPEHSLLPEIVMSVSTLIFIACIPFTSILFLAIRPAPLLAQAVVFDMPGYIAFILMLSLVFFAGLLILLRRLRSTPEDFGSSGLGRGQIYFALLANFVAGTLGITLNLLLPLFGNFSLFYINPIFVTIALIGIGFYNLLKYHLFNAKVVLTEFFTAGIWIISLIRLASSSNQNDALINGIFFIGFIFFGIFLIRSVLREVEQRERIEKLATELEATNERQEGLIHFIGHEVKGFLTKAQGTFSLMAEGELGPVPESMKPFVERALVDTKDGVESVSQILKASNLKKGTVEYKKEPFDLAVLAKEAVEKARGAAEAKHLALTFEQSGEGFSMTGDAGEISDHVLRNLIDNSVNYTLSGSIAVSLRKEDNKYIFSVKDTGIGIPEEDKARLFTEGGHGKDSQKVNAHSTGYGLFIAKTIVEAHGGTIAASSDGVGKGSTFTVEFPAS
ncbi:MAG: ATP-binding protein [Minisyncoccia bacterium]